MNDRLQSCCVEDLDALALQSLMLTTVTRTEPQGSRHATLLL